ARPQPAPGSAQPPPPPPGHGRYAPTQVPERFDPREYQRPGAAPGAAPRRSTPPPAAPPPAPPATPRRSAVPPPPPPRGRRRRRRRLWPWLVLTVVLLLIAVPAGLLLYLDRSLSRIDALPDYPGRIADTPGTNWLIVGSDSRSDLSEEEQIELGTGGDTGGHQSDTILMLSIPRSGKASLISIPRDSYVEVPGYGTTKINAAYSLGGAPLLTQTVEQATGVHIDHYAEIGF